MCKTNALHDELGDNHIESSDFTPLRADAFTISDDEKIERIKKDVENILNTLGMDLTDDSLKGTPNRVAKMFVKKRADLGYPLLDRETAEALLKEEK